MQRALDRPFTRHPRLAGYRVGNPEALADFLDSHLSVAPVLQAARLQFPRYFAPGTEALLRIGSGDDDGTAEQLVAHIIAPMPRDKARAALHAFRREWWRCERGDTLGLLFFTLG